MTLLAAPCFAWLYDGGPAQHLMAGIKAGTNLVSVAQPFVIGQSAYATSFGAALARGYGPVGAGVTVTLTTWNTGPAAAIDSWTIVPTSAGLVYYYVEPTAPIMLAANTPYSLVFTPDNPDFAANISYSRQGYYGYGTDGGAENWFILSYPLCARVDGYVIPEPSSALCVLIGALGWAGAMRRRFHKRCSWPACGSLREKLRDVGPDAGVV